MFTVALISRKGGAGKTTLACGIAVAGERARLTTVLVDLDPQGSASAWASLRVADTPAVISGHADQLPSLLTAARDAGANLVIIDTAPHSTDAALAAARAADLVLIPCRASVADLHAIGTSIEITRQAGARLPRGPGSGRHRGLRGRDGPSRTAPPDCPCARFHGRTHCTRTHTG